MIDVQGAIAAMRTAYSRWGIQAESCTEHPGHFTIIGKGRGGRTRIYDVPRTTARIARVHDADPWANEMENENATLDAMFAAFRNR